MIASVCLLVVEKLGDSTLGQDIFTLQTTLQDTPGYVSVFVCPGR
jgi:hypothetical protein